METYTNNYGHTGNYVIQEVENVWVLTDIGLLYNITIKPEIRIQS